MLLVLLALIFGSSNELYLLEIGDILGNSSSLITVDSSYTRSSSITFSASNEQGQGQPYTVILLPENVVPSTIMDYLPLERFPLLSEAESEYRGDFNYLGGDEPIYLLSGSSITYNLTITSNTTYPVCLYLFMNETHYNTFLMSVGSSKVYRYSNSNCFTLTNTTVRKRLTASASFFFNIINAGQYYVGIQLQTGITVQANASVVRVYYNTTGLQQQNTCNDITSCSIDLCSTFICSHEAITSFLIKSSNRTSINYSFTSPRFTLAEFVVSTTLALVIIVIIVISVGAAILVNYRSTTKSTLHKQQNRNSASAHIDEYSQNFLSYGRVFSSNSYCDDTDSIFSSTNNKNSGN